MMLRPDLDARRRPDGETSRDWLLAGPADRDSQAARGRAVRGTPKTGPDALRYRTHSGEPVGRAAFAVVSRRGRFETGPWCRGLTRIANCRRRFQPCGESSAQVTLVPG